MAVHPTMLAGVREVETKLDRLPSLADELGVTEAYWLCQEIALCAVSNGALPSVRAPFRTVMERAERVASGVADDQALAAGVGLVVAVQSFLAGRERERLELELARAVGSLQGLGVLVCRTRGGGRHLIAKRAQIEASAGWPLTVCVGKTHVVEIHPRPGETARTLVGPDACGVVCRDAIQLTGGRMWRSCCPSCEGKQRRRAAERQVRSLMADVRRGLR
jgi:hypothetical protein